MSILPLAIIIILIGIPSTIGAYQVIVGYGRSDISKGLTIVIYGAVLSFIFAYYLPGGVLTSGNYIIKGPVAFLISIFIGATIGIVSRRSQN